MRPKLWLWLLWGVVGLPDPNDPDFRRKAEAARQAAAERQRERQRGAYEDHQKMAAERRERSKAQRERQRGRPPREKPKQPRERPPGESPPSQKPSRKGAASQPRSPSQARRLEEVIKLCEEQKEISVKSWRASTEIKKRVEEETRKQEVLIAPSNQLVLRNLFRPAPLHATGFIRAGGIPQELKVHLWKYLDQHRSRSFTEAFDPLLGTNQKTKMLPLPVQWAKQGGFIDNILRVVVEKMSNTKMELVNIHGIRLYQEGSTLMYHVDGPQRPVTVAMLLSAQGAGESWHLEVGNNGQYQPMPLQPGQMLMYEGARLSHGRSGTLRHGEASLIFAYYRPRNYDPERVQRRVDQMLVSAKLSPRGQPAGKREKVPRKPDEQRDFRTAEL